MHRLARFFRRESKTLDTPLDMRDFRNILKGVYFTRNFVIDEDRKSFSYPILHVNLQYIVTAIVFNHMKEVLLVQGPEGPWEDQWYLPAGRLENEEDFEEGVLRELVEKTGYFCSVKFISSLEMIPHVWFRINFVCKIIGGELKKASSKTAKQALWFPVKKFNEASINLRKNDIIKIVEKAWQQSRSTKLFHRIKPVLKPVKHLYIRLVIPYIKPQCLVRYDPTKDKCYVLVSTKAFSHFPTLKIMNVENNIKSFIKKVFGEDSVIAESLERGVPTRKDETASLKTGEKDELIDDILESFGYKKENMNSKNVKKQLGVSQSVIDPKPRKQSPKKVSEIFTECLCPSFPYKLQYQPQKSMDDSIMWSSSVNNNGAHFASNTTKNIDGINECPTLEKKVCTKVFSTCSQMIPVVIPSEKGDENTLKKTLSRKLFQKQKKVFPICNKNINTIKTVKNHSELSKGNHQAITSDEINNNQNEAKSTYGKERERLNVNSNHVSELTSSLTSSDSKDNSKKNNLSFIVPRKVGFPKKEQKKKEKKEASKTARKKCKFQMCCLLNLEHFPSLSKGTDGCCITLLIFVYAANRPEIRVDFGYKWQKVTHPELTKEIISKLKEPKSFPSAFLL